MLTVDEYDDRERLAASELPNRVVEMVNPVTFASEGYPTRVRKESELWKYLDVMHETRFERDFASLFGGSITEQEFTHLRHVAQLASEFSQKSFGRNLTARSSLLRALGIYRHITDVFTSPASVFEIGPGSGYLGCLFILSGWSYAATDITQAFYLFQNRIWNHVSGGRVKDLADDPHWDGSLTPGAPVHIPWWEFYGMQDTKSLPFVDVVTCNHALAEMHPHSLAFTLRVSREMLRGAGFKAFVFEGWGYEKFVPRSAITREFHRAGFRLVHNDGRITVFAPEDAACASPCARLPRLSGFSGSRASQAHGPTRRLPLPYMVADLLETAGSLFFLSGLKHLAQSLRFWPPRAASRRNEVAKRILAGRERRATEALVGVDRVNEFYAQLMKTSDFCTADERFLAFIGKTV